MEVFKSEQLQGLFDSLKVDLTEEGTIVNLDSPRYVATRNHDGLIVANQLQFVLPPFDELKDINDDLADNIREGIIEYNQLKESDGVITQEHLQHRKYAFMSLFVYILNAHGRDFIIGLEGHPPSLQLITMDDIQQLEEMRMELFGELN